MGIPETILYTTEEEARHMFKLGFLCEPDPTDESVIMSNALINSAPLVAGISEPAVRIAFVKNRVYPISRALVGSDLANQLCFPASPMLTSRRILYPHRLDTWLKRTIPGVFKDSESTMEQIFKASLYDPDGITYNLPDYINSDLSSRWWAMFMRHHRLLRALSSATRRG